MVDALAALTVVIILIVAVWDVYTAGYTYRMLRNKEGDDWMYLAPVVGLIIGVVASIYVAVVVVISFGYALGQVSLYNTNSYFGWSTLVVEASIVALVVVLGAQIYYVAKDFTDVGTPKGTLYNTIASIKNVYVYVMNFGFAVKILDMEKQKGRKPNTAVNAILAIVATLLNFLLAYVAYYAGMNHANGVPVTMAKPAQVADKK